MSAARLPPRPITSTLTAKEAAYSESWDDMELQEATTIIALGFYGSDEDKNDATLDPTETAARSFSGSGQRFASDPTIQIGPECWLVFDADGNRLGLSARVNDKMFYVTFNEPPEGATSRAWAGPYRKNGES